MTQALSHPARNFSFCLFLLSLLMEQSGTGHAGVSVGSEWRSQWDGGLCVDWQRWILSVLHAGDEPWKLPAGLRRTADRGGETLCSGFCV